jgi:3-oxoacyl-[acyl-carrier protein] reductase
VSDPVGLVGRTAVVTAGGGVGIGRAVCLALAERGAKVIVTDRSAPRAAQVATELLKRGAQSASAELDVTRHAHVDGVMRQLAEEHGPIEILVNNAGISIPCPVLSMTDDTWDAVMNVCLRGMFWCTRAVLPAMVARGFGRIVNLASYLAFAGGEDQAHYAAAKAGVIAFTKSLAREVGRHGITVNAVAPGIILNEHLDKNRNQLSKAVLDELERGTSLGRQGAPEDVAKVIAFLASAQAGFVTGATVPVTGGLYMV